MHDIPNHPPLQIPYHVLLDLLFGTKPYPTLVSRVPNDPFTPHPISLALAKQLETTDPELCGTYFHIIKFHTHAELWYKKEWLESSSHTQSLRSSLSNIKSAATEDHEIFSSLMAKLLPILRVRSIAEKLAKSIMASHRPNTPNLDWTEYLTNLGLSHIAARLTERHEKTTKTPKT